MTSRASAVARMLVVGGMVVAAGLALTGCVPAAKPAPTVTVPTPQASADVFGLTAGECVDRSSASATAKTLPTVACASPHDGEVYDVFALPGGAFPGAGPVRLASIAGCQKAFATFAGISYEKSHQLSYWWLFPTEQSWGSGDRTVVCVIEKIDKQSKPVKSVGSLKGAKI